MAEPGAPAPAGGEPKSDGRRDTDRPGRAVALTLAGGALIVLNDGLIKELAAEMPVGQLLALRGLAVFVPITLLAWRSGGVATMFRIKSWPGQLLRGGCVVGAAFMFVLALRYLSLTDAVTISFAGPLFVTLLAPMMLGERVGWRRWLAVGAGFIGVAIIMQPTSTAFQWAALLPLSASVMSSLRDIVTRKLSASESSVSVLFVTTLLVVVAGFATWPFVDWVALDRKQALLLVGAGFLNGFAHFLFIEAFRQGEAALISPFKYFNVLWAMLFGFKMFGDLPTATTCLGAVVVVASGVYILHRESRRHRH